MNQRFNCLAAIVALVTALTAAVVAQQPPETAGMALRAAKDIELVKGDLEAAIKAYQALVTNYTKSDRATASEALLRMAECYRKLGDVQASKLYERVIKEFGDQGPPAAAARARVAANDSAPRNRLVWSIPGQPFFWGDVSPDGRWLAHANGFAGDMFVRDLAVGIDRRVTNSARPASAPGRGDNEGYGDDVSSFSWDGKLLAYSWIVGRREELRVIRLDGSSTPVPRVLLNDPDIQWVQAFGWSPDTKTLAVGIWRFNQRVSDLGVLSVETGVFTPLARVNDASGGSIGCIGFSPDGKYVAYNPDRDGGDEAREIVIVNVATKQESRLPLPPNRDRVIGWAPDGGIVFTSDRTGTNALWYAEFKSGVFGDIKPLGTTPYGYSRSTWWATGMTNTGALYYRIFPQSLSDVQILRTDFASGETAAVKTNAATTYIGASSQPAISADGTELAFVSRRSSREQAVVVRSLVTGTTRDLRTDLINVAFLTWAPDGSALFCSARGSNGPGLYRIDTRSGAATRLTTISGPIRQVSGDGARIYFDDVPPGGASGRSVMEFDLASGKSREAFRGESGGAFRLALSPDGRTVYRRSPVATQPGPHDLLATDVNTGRESRLVVGRQLGALHRSPDGRFILSSPGPAISQPVQLLIPTDGGGAKEFAKGFDFVTWSPDSRSIIAVQGKGTGASSGTPQAYWRVPVDGSAPTPFAIPLNGRNLGSVVAGGQWIAFVESDPVGGPNASAVSQLWVLENFLPKPQGGKGAGSIR